MRHRLVPAVGASLGVDPGDADVPHSAGTARNSITVAKWTLLSRVTGVARVAAIAAVLGPTYLGNTFQATNYLPNLTYELLVGSLFASLLVPPLVRHVDRLDKAAVERLAGGFLGIVVVASGLVVVIGTLGGPLLLRLLSIAVEDQAVASAQRNVGWMLMALLMPQVLLYGVAGTFGAVMNAHGRFAMAAGAPALENVGIVVTLGLAALIYGTGNELQNVETGQILLLGIGATASVGLHAGALWWGTWRLGLRIVPRAGWKIPEVRAIARLAVPSLGFGGLGAIRNFALLLASNRIPGGVVAFQMANNFFQLPVALAAKPVSVALLPELSRLHHAGDAARFRKVLSRGGGLIAFVTIPAALAYIVLARHLAEVVSFGEMATPVGVTLVAASLASMGLGVLGESSFVLGTQAAYALRDARSPLLAMGIRTVVILLGVVAASLVAQGTMVLVVLGISVTVGNTISALFLTRRVNARLPSRQDRTSPALFRAVFGSILMLGPAYAIASGVSGGGRLSEILGLAGGTGAGFVLYLLFQHACRSPELSQLRT